MEPIRRPIDAEDDSFVKSSLYNPLARIGGRLNVAESPDYPAEKLKVEHRKPVAIPTSSQRK